MNELRFREKINEVDLVHWIRKEEYSVPAVQTCSEGCIWSSLLKGRMTACLLPIWNHLALGIETRRNSRIIDKNNQHFICSHAMRRVWSDQ